jgi:hypothetical protein
MRKPFDVLAEGLLLKNSRDDKTAIELFLAGIRGREAGLRRRIDDGSMTESLFQIDLRLQLLSVWLTPQRNPSGESRD